jgi:hypothetical protein
MAKKSRRARRQQATRRPVASPPIEAKPDLQPSATPEEEHPAAAAPTPRKQEVDFVAEYRYVVDDLRSMAIIALAMVVVLIGLSFVIQ